MKPILGGIRSGATRHVWIIGRYAVKFPATYSWKHFLWGLLANIQEKVFSDAGWPELCPVIFYVRGGFLLVMPKCEPIPESTTQEELESFCDRGEYLIPAECKESSFGMLNGRMVAIDYGS